MTRVAVLDDWQGVARQCADWSELVARAEVVFFDQPFADEDAVAQALAGFDVILAMRERTPFPASLVARLGQLQMFGLTGKHAASIDIAALKDRGVTVCWTGGGESGAETAELALGLMLAAARHIPAGDTAIRSGRFQKGVQPGIRLSGKTLGIIGLGRIGSLVAGYGRALGMEVLAWSDNLTEERAAAAGAQRVAKHDLLRRADVVSLHLVLSDRTRGVIGGGEFNLMTPGTIVINTSRGPLIDEHALLAALESGRIIAALDVYDREPLAPDHPLRRAPNTVLTPHIGYGTVEVYRDFYQQSVDNVLAYLDGKPVRVL